MNQNALTCEDSWKRNMFLSGALAAFAPQDAKTAIKRGELQLAHYENSAGLHSYLVLAYTGATNELDHVTKAQIETRKLAQRGKNYLGPFLRENTGTLREAINRTNEHRRPIFLAAAEDYLILSNARNYIRMTNSERADMHMSRCVTLCMSDPVLFGEFADQAARIYVARKLTGPSPRNLLDENTFHNLNVLWQRKS